MNIAVLMSVHNRRDKTLSCLSCCSAQESMLKKQKGVSLRYYITDDGCTDGTADAIREKFPDAVIIKGDGNLFWNRGMNKAWKRASEDSPDFYLWLNDDTVLYPDSLAVLVENSAALGDSAIVAGTTEDSDGNISYGGRDKYGKFVNPDPVLPVFCDMFNGNIVLVPASVFATLGMLEPLYSHSFGDFDYGVRASAANIVTVVAPGILGRCDRNPGPPAWKNPSLPLRSRYKALMSPKGRPFKEQFVFDCRSRGFFYAVFHFFSLNMRVLFPIGGQETGVQK